VGKKELFKGQGGVGAASAGIGCMQSTDAASKKQMLRNDILIYDV